MFGVAKKDLDYALRFTETYRSQKNIAWREVACLAMQVPYVLEPMGVDDLIVGSMRHGFVGFSPQYGGTYTYYCHIDRIREALEQVRGIAGDAYAAAVEEMCAFWEREQTQAKTQRRLEERYPGKKARFYFSVWRVAGLNVDLDLLLRLGLDGLKQRTATYRRQNGKSSFYDAADAAVDILSSACLRYAREAAHLRSAASGARRDELGEIAAACEKIARGRPETFKEALQLLWIYAVCSDLMNYGRMDNYLGELYASDIDEGRLTEDEAVRWLSSLYRNIARVGKVHDSRIIIGGLGRRNPEAADRLAYALIRTSREVRDVVPQLTLRYYKGMDMGLVDETLRNIASGAVYPIVYSDDVIVPAVGAIYGVDRAMACNWVPLGCGEYVMEGWGVASPNSILTVSWALDLVLHKGVNSFTGEPEMEDMRDPAQFETFEDLIQELERILRIACEQMVYGDELNYRIAGEEACWLFASMLTHDCIEKNLPMFRGGCRFLGDTSEVFGLITTSDSLMAIRKLVYEEKRFTLPQLISMCDADFAGYEKERALLLEAPKYGNDDDEADAMASGLFSRIAAIHEEAARGSGLFPYKVCSVNNSGSADRGALQSATPDGRKRGQALSNGTSPSPGADRNGLTATLNSMARMDPACHVGEVHNLRFSRNLLTGQMEKIRQTLVAFFEHNGSQANLSSVNGGDLEQALAHPEQYRDLIVRVGGFSARFVELDRDLQTELVRRTTYEELS